MSNQSDCLFKTHHVNRWIFSQPSIYIDGWLYGMRMTSVTFRCCLKTIPHIINSIFTTWKWHPFATWTPSFIILVWGHQPPLRRTVFACLQNCYNSCISCSRSAIWFTLRYDSINSNLMNYSWTNGRLAIPALAGFLLLTDAVLGSYVVWRKISD